MPPQKSPGKDGGGAFRGAKEDIKKKRSDLVAKGKATREEEAAFIFHKYDSSKAGALDEADLLRCFTELGFSNGRQNRSEDELKEWARKELKRGDKKGAGKLTYEDFVDYYNRYIVGHRRHFEHTYELGQQIGKGAFGAVFRAKRIGGVGGGVEKGELVAVKTVDKDESTKSAAELRAALELLHNEITIWEQLKHPNLVRLLDVFETETHLYLVTELMRGGDLFQVCSGGAARGGGAPRGSGAPRGGGAARYGAAWALVAMATRRLIGTSSEPHRLPAQPLMIAPVPACPVTGVGAWLRVRSVSRG